MEGSDDSDPLPEGAGVGEEENGSSEGQENNDGDGASTIATTTIKTFVPTVAGERGIFAPWPKKVMCFYKINCERTRYVNFIINF